MQVLDHKNEGKGVWLNHDELTTFIKAGKDTKQQIAFILGGRCGLRSKEVTDVRPMDIAETQAGYYVRVQHGKGDKYRETPLPEQSRNVITTYSEMRPEGDNVPLVDTSRRTYRRWVKQAADRCRAATNDDEWKHLSTHDLRRSWGGLLVQANVEHGLIMEWGGWSDWETFREHYLGRYTPDHQRREREKVEWL